MSDTSLSLLERLRADSDSAAWQRLVALYSPLLERWIARYDSLQPADVDDLLQEVLVTLARELPGFEHNGRPGAFRSWLKAILLHRLRAFWRTRANHPGGIGGSDLPRQLDELADDHSSASRRWDAEHDRHVVLRLLDRVQPRFAAGTWRAFHRQMIEGADALHVAAELHMPLHSVYAAKSRVLAALRQEARGLVG
ncbi:MAG TPA: sigma-70 family RNA polymerase sigma factor [Planctomycetaceae bacterium]|nr:sigma-70 family RNA polymerase sigma factor [Planctomycetaceae bacterium]